MRVCVIASHFLMTGSHMGMPYNYVYILDLIHLYRSLSSNRSYTLVCCEDPKSFCFSLDNLQKQSVWPVHSIFRIPTALSIFPALNPYLGSPCPTSSTSRRTANPLSGAFLLTSILPCAPKPGNPFRPTRLIHSLQSCTFLDLSSGPSRAGCHGPPSPPHSLSKT